MSSSLQAGKIVHKFKVFQSWETELLLTIELKRLRQCTVRTFQLNKVTQGKIRVEVWLDPNCSNNPMVANIKLSGEKGMKVR